MSPVNLRVVGLGTAVTVAVLLPLVATARPTGHPVRPAGASAEGDAKPGDLLGGLGLGPRTPDSAASGPASAAPAAAPVVPAAPAAPERVTRCGPELASPEGAEAQTCVLGEEGEVWARTYYRNATSRRFDAFLTLMGPGGRTVQVSCPVPAQDEPGTCETPRERARGAVTAYTAVAELAGAGERDTTPLLLRAGSNTADEEGS
ncbi:hypothetical protein GCM10010275_08120 [Streptomyces litmocidini]|uniref:hypothetical protein n=1 Tax=Streptomyces litmocidini TaxID=67318 RepID=UPI00167EDAF3|nr:hypothetical protein [Streptomyces litmocidini]GGU76099.1 hypothetical protein GCM10010275_08120 [Streptomyces litmocidini]